MNDGHDRVGVERAALRRQAARQEMPLEDAARGAQDAADAAARRIGPGVEGQAALGAIEPTQQNRRGDADPDSPTGGAGVNHWRSATIRGHGEDAPTDLFSVTFEMTRMPMLVCDARDPELPIVLANGAFADLTGYSRDEVIGRNCRFLQGALTDRSAVADLRDALRERRPFACELLNYRKDGTAFWNALFIGPIFGQGGELLYFFASQLDVTRRRNSEDAFRQSQKMESIGQLTSGVAHDFNNLLQVMVGNHERAAHALPAASPARAAVERAQRAAQQAAKLVAQLLSFARKNRLEPRAVNLNAVLTEFGEMLSHAVGDALSLRFDLDPRLPACVVDPVHTEMAVLNLLTNARDAGGANAAVRTGTRVLGRAEAASGGLRAGRYVALEIADDGSGMAPEVLARATEPFFTTKDVGKGTGLGLSQVYGFVRQSGGRLEIESAPGRGTAVRILFPEALAEAAPAPSTAEPVLSPGGEGETILVVEDEEDVRDLAVDRLSRRGYRVLSAANGEEALGVLERAGGKVALLFTDVVMPGGMNGVVLAERARALRPGLPVLLATGFHEELADADRERRHIVLAKPYREAELVERVRYVINCAAAAAAEAEKDRGPKHEG